MRRVRLLAVAGPLLLLGSCARTSREAGPYTVSVPYDLDSLDPGERNRLSDFSLLSNLYEPLVVTDANLSPRPALATRWRNPDALTWLFELRPGVRFHDGSLLTAADVVWTFERLREDPALELAAHVSTIRSVRALDERTVEVRTAAPVGILLNKLRFVLVVRRGEGRAALRSRVNGTGPYRLEGFEKGRELALRRNEEYWGASPSLERVRVLLNRSPGEALGEFLAGRSDFVQANSRETETALRGRDDVLLRRNGSVSVKFLFLSLDRDSAGDVAGGRNPFRDVRVRRALSLAIDRADLVRRLSAPATPANQLVTPGIFGHDPSRGPLPYDPAAARRLLAEAGWPSGFELEFPARGLFAEAASIVAEMLGNVGVRARVRVLTEADWFPAMASGRLTMTLSRFGCPTGDASDLLESALQTRVDGTKAGLNNYSGYSSRRLDELIGLAGRTLEMRRRKTYLLEATALVMEEMPLVPLYVDQDLYAFRAGVEWTPRNDNFLIVSEIVRPR